jgi:hypothetical protein
VLIGAIDFGQRTDESSVTQTPVACWFFSWISKQAISAVFRGKSEAPKVFAKIYATRDAKSRE